MEVFRLDLERVEKQVLARFVREQVTPCPRTSAYKRVESKTIEVSFSFALTQNNAWVCLDMPCSAFEFLDIFGEESVDEDVW